jgi:hypothetical protein
MPPYGLYRIPSQHLYNSSLSTMRPRYNTLDFLEEAEPESDPAKSVVMEAAQIFNNIAEKERKDKAKDDKKKRMNKSTLGADEMPATPVPVPASAATSADVKKSKKKKREKDGDDAHASKKKRKRDSEIQASSPSLMHDDHGNGSSVVGADMLQNAELSMGSIGAILNQRPPGSESTERPSSKKIKSKRKSEGTDAMQAKDGHATPVIETPQDEDTKKKNNKKKERRHESMQTSEALFHLSPPVPKEVPAAVSPYVTTPKKTPIPLPQKSHTLASDTPASHQGQVSGSSAAEVLVTETPPSRLSRQAPSTGKTPIPFSLPRSTGARSGHKKLHKVSTILLSPPAIQNSGQISSAPPSSRLSMNEDSDEPNGRQSLTSSNLLRYTQPLSDEPKPRRRRRSGSISSASSMSIKDAIARMGKPSPASSAEPNPFFTPTPRKKSHHQTPFEAAISTLRSSVNFTQERAYLSSHLHIRAANAAAGPLPCLTKATGCTPKQEAAIALKATHPDPSLTALHAADAEHVMFNAAVSAAGHAETFLHHATLAQIPVPAAHLEGIYTLYCPKYAETHIDKYGLGHRTLTISRPSGFTTNTYTARLHIPPRSTTYSIRAFETAEHASFREVELQTTEEGYGMRLVVLGNGYVLLRVDLGLLLRGKKMDIGEGVGMEFLGVRERDVRGWGKVEWDVLRDRVDGEWEEKNKVEEKEKEVKGDESVKKKRGRPSNVELARRAREKEDLGRGE